MALELEAEKLSAGAAAATHLQHGAALHGRRARSISAHLRFQKVSHDCVLIEQDGRGDEGVTLEESEEKKY